jgi:hypothetical protein
MQAMLIDAILFRTALVVIYGDTFTATFQDGCQNRFCLAAMEDDAEYRRIAEWARYGDEWRRYGAEHELTHHWLADRLGWEWSWSLHDNLHQPWPAHRLGGTYSEQPPAAYLRGRAGRAWRLAGLISRPEQHGIRPARARRRDPAMRLGVGAGAPMHQQVPFVAHALDAGNHLGTCSAATTVIGSPTVNGCMTCVKSGMDEVSATCSASKAGRRRTPALLRRTASDSFTVGGILNAARPVRLLDPAGLPGARHSIRGRCAFAFETASPSRCILDFTGA